jgi:hypothetical protein
MRQIMDDVFTPGLSPDTVRDADGNVHTVPAGWSLVPPGDAALTRRVKVGGPHWAVVEKKGRKLFSRGVWTSLPASEVERIREELASERSTEAYVKKRDADAQRRERVQADYVEQFRAAIVMFLDFHPKHAVVAPYLAQLIADHATPVGSGTVARTTRIPIEERAEAAVIAWMRHKTTGYDQMQIPRIKGKRREVRRLLAQRSRELLERYRQGEPIPKSCPLRLALLSASVS